MGQNKMSQANGSKLSKQMLQFKSGGNFTSQPEMDNVVNNGLDRDSNNNLCAIYPKFGDDSALVLDSSSVEVVGGLDVAETLKTSSIQHSESDQLRIQRTSGGDGDLYLKFRKAKDPNSIVSGDSRDYTSIVSADAGNNYLPLHLDASTIKIESRSTGLEPGHQDEGILLYTNAGAGSTIGLENVFGENADAIKLDAKKGGIKLNA